jgi:molybdenum cofactor biosynthesis protein B
MIESAGHTVHFYQIVKDSRHEIKGAIENILKKSEVNVIIVTGGSGVSKRDVTPETVSKFFKREIPGFGEFFRMLSLAEVGTAAMLSRATAGQTRNGTFIFVLPGSTNAVKLGLAKLILPELRHLIFERTK